MSKAKKQSKGSQAKKQATKIPAKERAGFTTKTGIRAGGYGNGGG
jgi:hypothetical protein